MTQAPAFRLIGRSLTRPDSRDKVTGATRYTGDLVFPGLVTTRFVRSPYAAARIVSIDLEVARRMPGVVAALTARDLPVPDTADLVARCRIPLALDRVWHAGQAVAVVLAETPAQAEDAVALVRVVYDDLPAVTDPGAATRSDAPLVRESWGSNEDDLSAHGAAAARGVDDASRGRNVSNHVHFERGDADAALAQSDIVVEREYRTSWIHQGHLEPQVCVATVDPIGRLTVYVSHQGLLGARDDVAASLGLDRHDVVVHAMPVGGAFGAKWGLLEVLTAALARAVRRPVRVEYSRLEEFQAANPAPAASIRLRAGANRDGRLTALEAGIVFDSGFNPSTPVWLSGLLLGSTYRWPSFRIDGVEVLTNRVSGGAYRAPGAPQAAFAVESAVDELARRLGLDPIELRLRNVVREGDARADGQPWPRLGAAECLERALPIYQAEQRSAGDGEGVGVSLGGWPGAYEPAAAVCRLNADGTLHLSLGVVDLSGTSAGFQIIAAEAFGLDDPSKIRVQTLDSESAPYAGGTGGSKITYSVGPAVRNAALEARRQALAVAADALEAAPEDLEIRDGHVQVSGVPERRLSLGDIWDRAVSHPGGHGPIIGNGRAAVAGPSPAFAVHVARVHVDCETGLVSPKSLHVVQDVGRAINPAAVTGQMTGGAVQALGWGLFERMDWDGAGDLLTATLADYAIPTSADVPPVNAVLVEVPSQFGPYGAKGVEEPPVIPGGAAIANAVEDAVGVRLTNLPLTLEAVRSAVAGSAATDQPHTD